ncbi:MAG: FAD-binding oxidoreductase [Gammaproteobacteria bacterium]|nr:FAD-binding oxidoreductase [Gammaproteobacteria bacterium]MBT7752856.1 FAD-binding oxidoreductase [Gammaproteobacteria bacterium]
MNLEQLISEMRAITGPDRCITEPDMIQIFLEDWRGHIKGETPIVMLPITTDEVSCIIKVCSINNIAIVPQGGNTSLCGANIPHSDNKQLEIVINTSKMDKIIETDIHNQSMIVESGCILSNIQDCAIENNLFFPLSLSAEGSCQIGGNISTNAGGVNVLSYGMTREHIMGIEVVLPDGTVLNDLKGLRKDNTGYDLKQLFIGAEGTLGLITKASIKLSTLPKTYCSIMVAVKSVDDAIKVLKNSKNTFTDRLTAFEIMSSSCIKAVEKYLPEHRIPLDSSYPWHIIIEVSIHEEQPNEDIITSYLEQELESNNLIDGVIATNEKERNDFWKIRHSISEAEKHHGRGIAHDISVPIKYIPLFIEKTIDELKKLIGPSNVFAFGHLGDGNLHLTKSKPESMDEGTFLEKSHTVNRLVHGLAESYGGSFSAEHGIGSKLKDELAFFSDDTKLKLMKTIKKAIDPKNIMNPNKLF